MNPRSRLPALVLTTALLWPPASVRAGDEAAAPQNSVRETVDVSVPAPEAFADWPSDALRTRPYWLPWSVGSFRRASLFGFPVYFVLTVNWSRAAQRLDQNVLAAPDVMRTINANYVSVRVNADLRPDLRGRYDTGGWPAVEFLLPTAYPMLGRAQERDLSVAEPITTSAVDAEAMLYLVQEGVIYWNRYRALLIEMGESWATEARVRPPRGGRIEESASDLLVRWLLGNADRMSGGFGAAPKFLVSSLEPYAEMVAQRGNPDLEEHSRLTLEQLVASPLFDKAHGGIHRLAGLPGFKQIEYEKMLVGNTSLVDQLTRSLLREDSPALRQALSSTCEFIVDVLGRPGGGFYLAQIADPASDDGGGYWRGETAEAPPADPLVLSGPNAMAAAALLRAAALLDREDLAEAALGALRLLESGAFAPGRGVAHSIEPSGGVGSFLVSQSDAAFGLIDAYESTGDPRWLELARTAIDYARWNLREPDESVMRDHLAWPAKVGMLHQPRWPMRPNVRLARAMLRLSLHGGGEDYRTEGLRIVAAYTRDLTRFTILGTEAGLALEEALREPLRITIAGPAEDRATQALRRAAINSPWAWTVVLTDTEATSTSATVSFGDDEQTVTRPGDLAEAIAKLTRSGADAE